VPSTIDIRRRIRSVKNTQQITKAMKMVAAAKLRRSQDRIMAARPYAAALLEVLSSVASRVEVADHPLLAEREERNIALIVVTGDKGLAGAFNANVIKKAQRSIEEQQWNNLQLILLGRKGADFFRRRTLPIRHVETNIFQALSVENAQQIAGLIIDDYVSEKIDAVYVVYNEFKSVIQQTLKLERLLPFHRLSGDVAGVDYLYEPGPVEILQELLPKHIEFQLYRVLLESAAAEHGARMTAMDAASRNAGEMIESLTLKYNRIRQAAITTEITEIVSGAAALG
jgi:F-type H+-transporting ATPase subunit gamma